jgi:hypothetical protein
MAAAIDSLGQHDPGVTGLTWDDEDEDGGDTDVELRRRWPTATADREDRRQGVVRLR